VLLFLKFWLLVLWEEIIILNSFISQKKILFLTICFILISLILTPSVFGTPSSLSGKRKEAEELKKDLDEMDEKLSMATENYNEACYLLNKTKKEIKTNQANLDKATKDLAAFNLALNSRVEGIYKHGEVDFVEVLFNTKSFEDFIAQLDILKRIGQNDAELVEVVTIKKAEIEKNKCGLKKKEAKQVKFTAELKSNKSKLEKEIAERDDLYSQVKGQIANLEGQEAARRARLAQSVRGGGGASVSRAPGAPNGGVVDIAMRYLGCPYHWGAAGPSAFDCSGFTMFVYAQVGVGLPHSSKRQYGCGARVSRDQLQPGDLVFFGSPIHHVGIYVGGGNFIHAPHRGDVVSVDSLSNRRNYVGACRP